MKTKAQKRKAMRELVAALKTAEAISDKLSRAMALDGFESGSVFMAAVCGSIHGHRVGAESTLAGDK